MFAERIGWLRFRFFCKNILKNKNILAKYVASVSECNGTMDKVANKKKICNICVQNSTKSANEYCKKKIYLQR
jgi:hypothetical protein